MLNTVLVFVLFMRFWFLCYTACIIVLGAQAVMKKLITLVNTHFSSHTPIYFYDCIFHADSESDLSFAPSLTIFEI